MRFRLIRFLDKYIGIPICLILKLSDWHRKYPLDIKNPKKILLIKFWGMGSIILSSPLLRALREKFPESKIYYSTDSKNKGLYDNNLLIDYFSYVDIKNVVSSFSLLKLALDLRKEKFDIVIDLEQFSRTSAIISYLTGAKVRVGFDTKRQFRDILYTNKVNFDDKLYIVENYLNLGGALNIEPESSSLVSISSSEKDENELESILEKHKIKTIDILIGINPNASGFAVQRRWPGKYFTRLAQSIVNKYPNTKIVFTGSEDELPYVSSIIEPIEDKFSIINLAGKINLRQLALLMKRFKFFISNDSGPLHLAKAMNCPTISFFGPETPVLYAPKSSNDTVFYKNFRCSPCITVYNAKNTTCGNNLCLKAITPQEVMRDIDRRMNDQAAEEIAIPNVTFINYETHAKDSHIIEQ